MKAISSFLLGAVGLTVLGSAYASGDKNKALFEPADRRQPHTTAESSLDVSGKGAEPNGSGQPFSSQSEEHSDGSESDRSHSEPEKSSKRPRFGEGYGDEAEFLEESWSSDSRYGLGYELRMSGRRSGSGSSGLTGGSGPGASGSGRQGGAGH